jgi:two-component system response regulator AtoC
MENRYKIFIVEDDVFFNNILSNTLSLNKRLVCSHFYTGDDVLKKLGQNPDFILLDYNLTDMTADDVIKKFKANNPNIKIIMISGQTDIKIATKLIKLGADDYVIKDENALDNLNKILQSYIKEKELLNENTKLKNQFEHLIQSETFLIGNSSSINNIKEVIVQAAQTSINIAVIGEQGTGKRFISKVIHRSSKLSHLPLHEIGFHDIDNFTNYLKLAGDASRKLPEDYKKFEAGTFFINEITDFSMQLQSSLINFINNLKEKRRKANNAYAHTHRFIIASRTNLRDLFKNKQITEELYFELLGLIVDLVPLRQRAEDIGLLAEEFKNDFCRNNNIMQKIISQEAKNKLTRYNYPGNVKELKATIELACVLSNSNTITGSEVLFNSTEKPTYKFSNVTLDDFTAQFIYNYLKRNDFQVVKTANELGISKSKIYNMLKEGRFNKISS